MTNNQSNVLQGIRAYRLLTYTSMFAALITIMTAYFFHIPVGTNGGYIHLGDTFIYLAASFLPMPYALAAAAIGGGLADVLSGASIWAPATIIIKPLIALAFTSKKDKIINKNNILALLIALLITTVGYYIAEAIITSNWVSPIASIWGSVIQSVGSAAAFIIISVVLDRLNFKKRIFNFI